MTGKPKNLDVGIYTGVYIRGEGVRDKGSPHAYTPLRWEYRGRLSNADGKYKGIDLDLIHKFDNCLTDKTNFNSYMRFYCDTETSRQPSQANAKFLENSTCATILV